SLDVSTHQLEQVAGLVIEGAHYMPSIAHVVAIHAKDDEPFALARMWQVLVQQTGWETAVFRERADAVAWVRERVRAKFGLEVPVE
ncbi:MAG: hypothetical protein JO347_02675, partial [Candidatus Eremiobacteraeota bacterium]|nr:hypothetical protein [Candidatus Eremiobacteraeota bacterium]